MRIALVCCVGLASVSCSAPVRPTAPVAGPPADVAWRTMVRDRPTLEAYAGRLVRFRLDRGDCDVEGDTLRAWWGDRNVPPALVVRCVEPPSGPGPYSVVGLCGDPVSDGVRRGVRIDYAVEVTGARAVTVPAP